MSGLRGYLAGMVITGLLLGMVQPALGAEGGVEEVKKGNRFGKMFGGVVDGLGKAVDGAGRFVGEAVGGVGRSVGGTVDGAGRLAADTAGGVGRFVTESGEVVVGAAIVAGIVVLMVMAEGCYYHGH